MEDNFNQIAVLIGATVSTAILCVFMNGKALMATELAITRGVRHKTFALLWRIF